MSHNCFARSSPLLPKGFALHIRELKEPSLPTEGCKTFLVTVKLGPRSGFGDLRSVSREVTVPIPLEGPIKWVPNPFYHLLVFLYFRDVKAPHRIEYSCVSNRPPHTFGVQSQEGTFLALKREKQEMCRKSYAESLLRFTGNPAIVDPSMMYSYGLGWMRIKFELYMRTKKPTKGQVSYIFSR